MINLVSDRTSPRFIRDPIHRDIRLDPIESAVVDTRIFQRLRYIRQNGLLHLVFPGAVHTRFAHSLGTMDIARRVAASLFEPLRGHSNSESLQGGIDYLEQVFRLAALLHDVGHGAFSHSIEHASRKNGQPFLGTTRDLFTKWGQEQLLESYARLHPNAANQPVSHEQIGLILVAHMFSRAPVVDVCQQAGWNADDLSKDVQAIMNGQLPVSARFEQCASDVARAVESASGSAAGGSIAPILHSLVSGTLDVDRLDYLIRDSVHCGVPYGTCEVELLVKSLSLSFYDGQVILRLDRKAAHALDDMLWSRYQLFLQVLNHKTNVGLNAVLSAAIIEMLSAGHLAAPHSMDEYVALIDDRIIGEMFKVAQMEDSDDNRLYIKLFVDRRVPRHLEAHRLEPDEDLEQTRDEIRGRLAKDEHRDPSDIIVGVAKSELVKDAPTLPQLWDRRRNAARNFRDESTVLGSSGVGLDKYRVLHFFCTRD